MSTTLLSVTSYSFGAPIMSKMVVDGVEINGVLAKLPGEMISFEQCIIDFELSIFDSVVNVPEIDSSSSCICSSNVLPLVSRSDSLIARVSYVEGLLGIYHLAFWGFHSEGTIKILVTLCRNAFEWDVTEQDFVAIHRLDNGRAGILVRVSSLNLKERVLERSVSFERLGFGVGLY